MRVALAILFACATIVLVGCSDDERPVRTVKAVPGSTLQMGADEYRFDPGRIVVRMRGESVRLGIVLKNRGSLAHNIHVRDGTRELAATRSFKPGGREAVKLDLPRGTYDFLCTVADHDELGMTGTIEVRQGAN